MIASKYTVLEDTEYWVKQAEQKSKEFWDMCRTFDRIALKFDIKWIYTGRQMPDNKYQYILSSSFYPYNLADCLEPLYDGDDLPETVESYKTGKFAYSRTNTVEAWGDVAAANILITDKLGSVCGFLGANYNISKIYKTKLIGRWSILAALVLSIVAALLLSKNIRKTLLNPLYEMRALADDMSQLHFDRIISKDRTDEIGDMQKSMVQARYHLKRIMQDLTNELEKLAVMKDNLRIGVFIMDKHYIIQEFYFPELENILSAPDCTGDGIVLAGKNFIDILRGSLNNKEQELLSDYFEMILSGNYDQSLIDEINPFEKLVYKTENGGRKTLQCNFVRFENITDCENGTTKTQVFILARIEDISAQVNLEQRIPEVQQQTQQEMQVLFDVIHIDPIVCDDIIVNAEHNFNKIKLLLQETEKNQIEAGPALTSIFQLIHAMKSDAIIVGLKSFSEKLHETESFIKSLQDKTVVPAVLTGLSAEIEKLIAEKNKLITAIQELSNYHAGRSIG